MAIFDNPHNDIQLTIYRTRRDKYLWVARHGKTHVASGNISQFDDPKECERFARMIFKDVKSVVHKWSEGLRKEKADG